MQLIQSTLKQNPYNPLQSFLAGAQIKTSLNANMPLILTAYNARPKAVNKNRMRIPPFIETRLYVPQVLGKY
jgi:soluble lytic murein transglycosylase-like protein